MKALLHSGPNQGGHFMAAINLTTVKNCFATQETGQDYADCFTWIHNEVYGKPTRLFAKDFYFVSAHKLKNNKPVGWEPIFHLTDQMLQAEEVFKKSVLETSSLTEFKTFMPIYTEFAKTFIKELEVKMPYSPFFIELRSPLSLAWFTEVVKELAEEQEGFSERFKEADPEAFIHVFRIALLKGVQNPDSSDLPECFKEKPEFKELSEKYFELSGEEMARLRRALLDLEPADSEHGEHSLFIAINQLYATLDASNRPFYNGLLRTISL